MRNAPAFEIDLGAMDAQPIAGGDDQVGSDGRVRPANQWNSVKSLEEAIANPVPGQDTHLPR
jgi:hypothetical protein